jgi:RES domain-containing protein
MFKKFNGDAYRSHDPMWSFEPTSGEGASFRGARFNPKGTHALYLSLSQVGALIESQQALTLKSQPKLLCTYEVNIDKIVDLTNIKVCAHYDIDPTKLGGQWIGINDPYPQLIAKKLIKHGANGIIVPSFAKGADNCINLVLWRWSDKLPRKVTVIDDNNALPKNQDSWR